VIHEALSGIESFLSVYVYLHLGMGAVMGAEAKRREAMIEYRTHHDLRHVRVGEAKPRRCDTRVEAAANVLEREERKVSESTSN
jgi:hypothetical protein